MMLVSVVIPVYKVEPYLRDCVDSVLGQTYRKLQVILVDDGSPDGCPAICDEYARQDSRVQVIHRKNGGLSVARNSGMAVANGEYLYFIDSDDMIKPNMIERCVDLCERENLDQLNFNCELFVDGKHSDESSISFAEKAKKWYDVDAGEYDGKIMSGPELFKALWSKKAFFVTTQTKFFRKSAVPEYLAFPPGLIHEDLYFAPLSLLAAHRATFIHDKLFIRRVRSESIMTAANTTKKHSEAVLEIIRLLKNMRCVVPPDGIATYDDFCNDLFSRYRHYSGTSKSFWNKIRSYWLYYGFSGCMKKLFSGFVQKRSKHTGQRLSKKAPAKDF